MAGSQVKMWQLQAAYSWRFCGGRLPDERGSWKLNLLYLFLRWQAPRWKCDSCKLDILDVFAVAGSQMKMRHLQATPSVVFCGGRFPDECVSWKLNLLNLFFCGGRLPGENVHFCGGRPPDECSSWKLDLFFFPATGCNIRFGVLVWGCGMRQALA